MKKKALSLALALVMCLGLAVPAFAEYTVTEVIPCKYNAAYDFSEGLAVVWEGDKKGYIDKTGRMVLSCDEYRSIENFSEGLARVRRDGKWGYIDKTGQEVIPCKYAYAKDFSHGAAQVHIENGNYGFIDKTGREVTPIKYTGSAVMFMGDLEISGGPDTFHEGLGAVHVGGDDDRKYGFVDEAGREVVPCKYDNVGYFSEGLAAVWQGDKMGFIDKTGREVIPCKYEYKEVYDFHGGLAQVSLDLDKCGLIDKTGRVVLPLKYDLRGEFSEGLVWMYQGGKYSCIDQTGREVIPPIKYDFAREFSEGMAVVGFGDIFKSIPYKYGYIDKTGREIVPCKYDEARAFHDGMAIVSVGAYDTRKFGFIDKTGREVVPPKYDSVRDFSDGLAQVRLNGKYGYIDKTGREVVPLIYDSVSPVDDFSDGVMKVGVGEYNVNRKCGYIDKTGREVVPCAYDDVGKLSEGMVWVRQNYKYGFISVSGIPVEPDPEPTTPVQPQQPAAETIANPTNDKLEVNGAAQNPTVYKIGGSNYFKIRDVAAVLNGTGKQFAVGYSGGKVTVTSGQPYEATGKELAGAPAAAKEASPSNDAIVIDGVETSLTVYKIGGSNYFKLRDLGKALNFYVGWEAGQGVYIETDKPYSK